MQIPSMEGRTIARPNDARHRPKNGLKQRQMPSMEGRTIARPNCPRGIGSFSRGIIPSMEGRTIARPNHAGSILRISAGNQGLPSMEGRTIARPNPADAYAVP